ncbi:MAG: HD domain-containing protein [Deltaproteobacteria bacterium]|nr:HD domain-containing protein [Deltaproteobacteria bacterium]
MTFSGEGSGTRFSLIEIVLGLSSAVDLVDPALADHHARVACLAHQMAVEMGLDERAESNLVWAGLLHDIGAFSLKERLEFLRFDIGDGDTHAEVGYRLVRGFKPFDEASHVIRYHHSRWEDGRGTDGVDREVPLGSHILHLADRISVIMGKEDAVLGRVGRIVEQIVSRSGEIFNPDVVEAFRGASTREAFWLEATYPAINQVLEQRARSVAIDLTMEDLTELAKLFCRIIDFRSSFTATHSNGVAAVAKRLALLMGVEGSEATMMMIAGYLHDLGKLAVPLEILEKPAPLTLDERNTMRKHPYLTYRLLSQIKGLERINAWAAHHHECPDGAGYPFRIKGDNLSLGARIVTVADVFTALAEDRPYRPAFSGDAARWLLRELSESGKMDPSVVRLVNDNFDEVNSTRIAVQEIAVEEYRRFRGAGPRD